MNPASVCPTCGDETAYAGGVCPKHRQPERPESQRGRPEFMRIRDVDSASHRSPLPPTSHSNVDVDPDVDAEGLQDTLIRGGYRKLAAKVVVDDPVTTAANPPSLPERGRRYSEPRPVLRPHGQGSRFQAGDDSSRERTILDGRVLRDSVPPKKASPPLASPASGSALSPAAGKDPLIGTQLGEYRVDARIGTGGMGIVYKGHQPLIGKPVAIKVLRGEVAQDPEHVARLLAEARAVNAIRHRGIIDIFGFGELPSGQPYIVMEYLDGLSVDRIIAERAPLNAAEVVPILEELLLGLGAAHAAGVIHRDLKPNNLFLVDQPDGSRYVKILDFGLSKKSPLPHASAPQTRLNAVVGTPEYMAPEQARALPVSPQTDLYSLGVVLFEMLTGKLPFEANSPVEMLMRHVESPAPRVSSLVKHVPPELDQLVARLMEKAPERRPVSADSLLKEVRRLRQRLHTADTQVGAPLPALHEAPAEGTQTNIEPMLDPLALGGGSTDAFERTPTNLDDPGKGSFARFALALQKLDPLVARLGGRRRAGLLGGAVALLLVVCVAVAGGSDSRDPDIADAQVPAPEALAPVPLAPTPGGAPQRLKAQEPLSRASLLRRITKLERALQARTPSGRRPDPMAERVLREQRQRTEAEGDWSARQRVARELDAWEERFLAGP